MAQRTDSYLTTEANIIQNETATGANTALRVGTMLNDVIDSKINNDRVSDSTALGNDATIVPSQNAVKTYVDTILVGYLNDRGNYDPTITSGYPTTGGSGSGGIIEQGDLFFISADGSIISGDAVPITTPVFTGYTVRALVSTPGQLYANWAISNVGIGYIPENSANKSTDNTLGGLFPSGVLFSTQKAVKEYVDNEIAAAVPYTAENVANKIQDLTIAPTSTVQYPSSKAVTDYINAYATGWSLTGNAGTTPGTNFIGTTDAKDVVIKANNTERLRIDKTYGTVTTTENITAVSATGNSINVTDGLYSYASLINDPITDGGYLYAQNLSGVSSSIKATNITSNRVHQLPDADGTLALQAYKEYTGLLNYDGTTVSVIVLKNTLGTTLNWTDPVNGYFRGTAASGTPFTLNKTWINVANYNNAGQPYIPTAQPRNATPTTAIDILMYLYNGTLSGWPNVTNLPIEIRVYP
jgi:hypothetical protein